jgi:branched-chain amino acid transport system ATP-binding protein
LTALLQVGGLCSGYGAIPVLHGVSLEVPPGEIATVIGANGAGKSTLLLSIAGHLRPSAGSVRFDGAEIAGAPAHGIVSRGLVMVLEGGRLFPFMTVQENLQLGAYHAAARRRMGESMQEVMELFPFLPERRHQLAGKLSGGERTMVAIARAMMSLPRLLMLDEPSLGLAPIMVERVFDLVRTLARSKGIGVLLVEQNVGEALEMSRHAWVMERGQVVQSGEGRAMLADPGIQRAYLGL